MAATTAVDAPSAIGNHGMLWTTRLMRLQPKRVLRFPLMCTRIDSRRAWSRESSIVSLSSSKRLLIAMSCLRIWVSTKSLTKGRTTGCFETFLEPLTPPQNGRIHLSSSDRGKSLAEHGQRRIRGSWSTNINASRYLLNRPSRLYWIAGKLIDFDKGES